MKNAVLIVFLVFCATPTFPQVAPDWLIDQTHRATERALRDALSDLEPYLTPDQQGIIDQTRITSDRHDWNIYGTRAQIGPSGRSIHFPMGFQMVNLNITWAVAANLFAGHDPELVMEYALYMSDTVRASIQATARKETPPPMLTYSAYVGMPQAQSEQMISNGTYLDFVDILMRESITLILAHEIGHHVLGHLNNTYSSLDEEMQADAFAIDLVLAAGNNPIAAFAPFLVYAGLEADPTSLRPNATHPPGLCRVITMLVEGHEAAIKDPDFVAYMRRTGRYEGMVAALEQLRTLPQDSDISCPS